ncbi:MAG: thioesterase family protein [Microbacteriaceae bacterium]
MIFRTLFFMLRGRRADRIHVHDVALTPLRVWPTDLDILGHMNNGVYLSIMDLGRMDLLVRSGVWAEFTRRGFYPVVASETITFRKSLQPWQRYVLETRIVGYDAKAVYVEQRFVVDGEIFAQAFVRGRFLKKGGGVVSVAELSGAIGLDVTDLEPPEWLANWGARVALPPTRAEAPSIWND